MASQDMKDRSPAVEELLLAPAPETKRGFNIHVHATKRGNYFVYCNGRSVFLRSIDDPTKVRVYAGHRCKVNVAKVSPSGRHVASGDCEGNVNIWEILDDRFNDRNSYEINSSVKDIAWSPDNKRIIVAGASGGGTFAKAILVDSGNSVGVISGHNKNILTVDYRQTRPYRAVTGSEDSNVIFHQGPPFKRLTDCKDHTNYVTCTRYSPDGSLCASVSNDMKVFLFDGKTGEKVGEIKQKKKSGHKGTIYSCSWTADSKQLLTSSADKMCKLWDVEEKKCVATFQFGEDVKRPTLHDMQVSCLSFADHLISVSLGGAITFLDAENPAVPKAVWHGPQTNIKSLVVDRANNKAYAGELNGNITCYDLKTGQGKWFGGKRIESCIVANIVNGDKLETYTMDDKLRTHDIPSNYLASDKKDKPVAIGGHSVAIAQANTNPAVTACVTAQQKIVLLKNGAVAAELEIKFEPKCIAWSTDDTKLWVGGRNNAAAEFAVDVGAGTITATDKAYACKDWCLVIAPCPDGKSIVCADRARSLTIYSLDTGRMLNPQDPLKYHTATITGAAWSPDGSKFATVSADCKIIVWYDGVLEGHRLSINAHNQSIAAVAFVDNNTIISAGGEITIKTWKVPDTWA